MTHMEIYSASGLRQLAHMPDTGISMSPTISCSEAELIDNRHLSIADLASPDQAWSFGRSERWIYDAARWTVENIPAPGEDEGNARYRLLWDQKTGEPVMTFKQERIAIVTHPLETKRGRPVTGRGWKFAWVRESGDQMINIDPFCLPEWIDKLSINGKRFSLRINAEAIRNSGLEWEETILNDGSKALYPKPRSSPLPLAVLEAELYFYRKMLPNSHEPCHVSLCQGQIDIIEGKIAAAKRQPD